MRREEPAVAPGILVQPDHQPGFAHQIGMVGAILDDAALGIHRDQRGARDQRIGGDHLQAARTASVSVRSAQFFERPLSAPQCSTSS